MCNCRLSFVFLMLAAVSMAACGKSGPVGPDPPPPPPPTEDSLTLISANPPPPASLHWGNNITLTIAWVSTHADARIRACTSIDGTSCSNGAGAGAPEAPTGTGTATVLVTAGSPVDRTDWFILSLGPGSCGQPDSGCQYKKTAVQATYFWSK